MWYHRPRFAAPFTTERETRLRSIVAATKALAKAGIGAGTAAGTAWSALWTFPSILLSPFIIAWAAEAAQFLISQGLALAILAWLQTLPEFAVEAVIAWQAGKDPTQTHLAIANFTGSLRLLVGLGWPMIYFVAAAFGWKSARRMRARDRALRRSLRPFPADRLLHRSSGGRDRSILGRASRSR